MNIPRDVLEKIRDWRPVVGWEDTYEVSRLGEIRSIARWVTYTNGRKRFYESQRMRTWFLKRGYRQCEFTRKCERQLVTVHRIVGKAFIPNPNNLPEINHRDYNPSNNFVWNLEWVDRAGNVNYGDANKRRSESNKKTWKEKVANGYTSPTKGRTLSEEQKQHLSEINTGKKMSQETKDKISKALKGKPKKKKNK